MHLLTQIRSSTQRNNDYYHDLGTDDAHKTYGHNYENAVMSFPTITFTTRLSLALSAGQLMSASARGYNCICVITSPSPEISPFLAWLAVDKERSRHPGESRDPIRTLIVVYFLM